MKRHAAALVLACAAAAQPLHAHAAAQQPPAAPGAQPAPQLPQPARQLPQPGAPPAVVPQVAVVPQDITVGDVFSAAIRLTLPAGVQLAAPDSLVLPENVEHGGRREVRVDTAAATDPEGSRRVTIVYPLAAWRPGAYELQPFNLRLVGDGYDAPLEVRLPAFEVRSVLPPDTAGIEPRPARDVLGPNRLWWPILLALLLAAVVIGALYYWWRRRKRPEPVATPAPVVLVLPRAAALQRLEELRRSGLVERGDLKAYYEGLSTTLRQYVATLRPQWSTDLTTGELAGRLRAGDSVAPDELLRILGGADMVKFARARPAADVAWRDLDAAIAWITQAEPDPEPEPGPEGEPRVGAAGTDDRRVA